MEPAPVLAVRRRRCCERMALSGVAMMLKAPTVVEYCGMSYEQASREASRLIERGWYQNFERLVALYLIMIRERPA